MSNPEQINIDDDYYSNNNHRPADQRNDAEDIEDITRSTIKKIGAAFRNDETGSRGSTKFQATTTAAPLTTHKGKDKVLTESTDFEEQPSSHSLPPSQLNALSALKGTLFSEIDLKIMKILLETEGRTSTLRLSRELNIPLTTVQRRRKRLEREYLTVQYSIRPDKLGLRNGNLLISTAPGKSSSALSIGRELLLLPETMHVRRTLGNGISLVAEISFKDNKELIKVVDRVKSIEGISDVLWIELIENIEEKKAFNFSE